MLKNKPITLLVAAGLLVLLIAAAGVFPLLSSNTPGGFAGGRNSGNLPGGMRTFPQDGNFTPGGNPPSGMMPSDGVFQPGSGQMQRGNFEGNLPSGNTTMIKLIQLLRGVQLAGAVIVLLAGVLSLVGILLGKVWGRKTALATAILAFLFTVVSIFPFPFGWTLIVKIAALLFAISILVLCLLPKSRASATVPA